MSLIMISCRQASELMSQQLDRPLKLGEKFRLHAHLVICKSCPKTLQQFEILRQAGNHYAAQGADQGDADLTLTPDAKQRILQTIEEKYSAFGDDGKEG